MKLSLSRFLAANSWIFIAFSLGAATRPHFGGTLRIELQAQLPSLALSEKPDSADAVLSAKLQNLVYDRLVRLDARGQPRPALAVSWELDARGTKWRLKLRPDVKWHDGSPFTAADAVGALAGTMPESHREGVRAEGDTLEIDAGDRDSNFVLELATSARWIIRRVAGPPGALPLGTGPFRVTVWQPGRSAVLQANEDYWGGRPYLDTIQLEMGRASRERLIELELDRADLVQLDPAEARRAQQEGRKIWTSVPVELIALRFNPSSQGARDRRLREAIASSIDRGAIQKVLVQSYGEVAGAILPQWLSGYAFLFRTTADLERARKLKVEIGNALAVKVGYDQSDALARQVAERLVVNAREVGLTLEASPLPPGSRHAAGNGVDAQVGRARIDGPTLDQALSQALAELAFSTAGKKDPENVYAAEREFLSAFSTVPLVYVPELVGLGSRVRNWSAARWGDWHLDEVWLEGRP